MLLVAADGEIVCLSFRYRIISEDIDLQGSNAVFEHWCLEIIDSRRFALIVPLPSSPAQPTPDLKQNDV